MRPSDDRRAGRIPQFEPADFFEAMLRTGEKAAENAILEDWIRIRALAGAVRDGAIRMKDRDRTDRAQKLLKRAKEGVRAEGRRRRREDGTEASQVSLQDGGEHVEVLDVTGKRTGYTRKRKARNRVARGDAVWIVAWLPTIRWTRKTRRPDTTERG